MRPAGADRGKKRRLSPPEERPAERPSGNTKGTRDKPRLTHGEAKRWPDRKGRAAQRGTNQPLTAAQLRLSRTPPSCQRPNKEQHPKTTKTSEREDHLELKLPLELPSIRVTDDHIEVGPLSA